MDKSQYILSIDQGTSGTKVVIFDHKANQVVKSHEPLASSYKKGGWVEQDPQEIYKNVISAVDNAVNAYQVQGLQIENLTSCGISNQRETFLVWDKKGKPLYKAIVWQCKRSVEICNTLRDAGKEPMINEKTGLIIDPYFSGTKLIWLIQNSPKVAKALENGELYFGTIDTWLLFKLTKGEKYLTDYTNACRTLFFNINTLKWDEEILEEFGLKGLNLPEVKPSSYAFGESNFEGIFDKPFPITGMIGDSHAAAFGEQCFSPGTAKATLGTGCSVLMNIGDKPKKSSNGMISTICWSTEDRIDFAAEGVIVTCGATIEWLKNNLGLIKDDSETQGIAESIPDNNGVYFIPAFSGLGAPYWEMSRKASIEGMSFDCNKNHIVRAALESIPYQIKDVINAMEEDMGVKLEELCINGGISQNTFVTQFLTDLLDCPVNFLEVTDVSALGAAYMAGLSTGVFKDIEHIKQLNNREEIKPSESRQLACDGYQGWKKAINKN